MIQNQYKLLTSLREIISFRLRLQCNEIYNRVLEFRFCHFCFMSLCVRLLDIDKCLQLFGGYHDGNQTWIGIKPSIILMCIIIHLSHCVRSSSEFVWVTLLFLMVIIWYHCSKKQLNWCHERAYWTSYFNIWSIESF